MWLEEQEDILKNRMDRVVSGIEIDVEDGGLVVAHKVYAVKWNVKGDIQGIKRSIEGGVSQCNRCSV